MDTMSNFDEILDRTGSSSVKWDLCRSTLGDENLLPMWVADMDFRTPSFVTDEIQRMMSFGVLGYTAIPQRWYDAIIAWYASRFSCGIVKEEMTFIPGIVRGIAFVEQCFTQPGDKVIVLSPVYHPFFLVSRKNGREVVYNSLILNEEARQYDIDFDTLSEQIKGCKVMILSNPHNPGGKVWTKEELARIAEIAADNGCLVISDEIHCDLTQPGYVHHPFFTVSEKAASNSIVFGAPSKAFNMPGVVSSYAIVKNPEIFKRFEAFLSASEFDRGNMFAYDTCAACYEKGSEWLAEMLAYVKSNYDFLQEFLRDRLPMIHTLDLQATYLVFLDCRELGLEQKDLVDLFVRKAGVVLNDGTMFGPEGKGFMRLNIGCPRSMLEEGLTRLEKAIKG